MEFSDQFSVTTDIYIYKYIHTKKMCLDKVIIECLKGSL